jgi:hypothetical protein
VPYRFEEGRPVGKLGVSLGRVGLAVGSDGLPGRLGLGFGADGVAVGMPCTQSGRVGVAAGFPGSDGLADGSF